MLDQLLDSIRGQADLMFTLSVAGLGFLLIIWANLFGVRRDIQLREYCYPYALLLPILLFSCAYYYAMEVFGALTGFYFEAVAGYTTDATGERVPINDPAAYFLTEYAPRLTKVAFRQYVFNFVAIAVTILWFVGNFVFNRMEGHHVSPNRA